jgi:hypothetical protein
VWKPPREQEHVSCTALNIFPFQRAAHVFRYGSQSTIPIRIQWLMLLLLLVMLLMMLFLL